MLHPAKSSLDCLHLMLQELSSLVSSISTVPWANNPETWRKMRHHMEDRLLEKVDPVEYASLLEKRENPPDTPPFYPLGGPSILREASYEAYFKKLLESQLDQSNDGFGFARCVVSGGEFTYATPPCHSLDLEGGWSVLLATGYLRSGLLLMKDGKLNDGPNGMAAARVYSAQAPTSSRSSDLVMKSPPYISAECHLVMGKKWNPSRHVPAQTIISAGSVWASYYIDGQRRRLPKGTPVSECFQLPPGFPNSATLASSKCTSITFARDDGSVSDHIPYSPPPILKSPVHSPPPATHKSRSIVK